MTDTAAPPGRLFETAHDIHAGDLLVPAGTPVSGVYQLDTAGKTLCYAHLPDRRVKLVVQETELRIRKA